MAESSAYARRGFKGGAQRTNLSSDVSDSATTISCSDLSTWSSATSNGPATATINRGAADEEIIEFTGISSNDLTGVTRGVGGSTAAAHTVPSTIELTSQVRDFDESNRLVNAILGIASLASGDLLYLTSATTFARLAKGTARQQLAMNSGAAAPEWVASLQSLLTAQGDTVYASSANTPARLAKGTAFQVMRMNSGATAPEWGSASQIEVARVETSETTTSTSFTALSTAGPAVTVTVPASGKVLVTVTAQAANNTGGETSSMGFAVSGASTVASTTSKALRVTSSSANNPDLQSATFLLTGLTAGSTTFTAEYAVGAGTGSWAAREIIAETKP